MRQIGKCLNLEMKGSQMPEGQKQGESWAVHEDREPVVILNEGQKIFGVMHIPKNANKKSPAIVTCHGFAGVKCGRFRVYVSLAEMLSALGIITLRIDFRGFGDSEGQLNQMTIESQVSDAVRALEFLEKHPLVDAAKLGILGCSLGGAVSVLAASRYQKLQSIALWVPLFSSPLLISKDIYQRALAGDNVPEEMLNFRGYILGQNFVRQFLTMSIENALVECNQIPMLLVHGLKDKTISPEHIQQYKHFRNKADRETRIIALPEGDHDFTIPSERTVLLKSTAAWFEQTLIKQPQFNLRNILSKYINRITQFFRLSI